MEDVKLMQRALELAEKGHSAVSPNPMVGAVIFKDGNIIGEGYHQFYGGPHAEINALKSAATSCKGATLFLTLEPCAHHGKTPPCVNAVIEAGFKRVVIATVDPNPKTNGRSVSMMMDAGIDVDIGLLEDKARKQNEVFFKYVTTGIPFVILKIAQTLDARIADPTGKPKWITCDESRNFVQILRSQVDAIMIGSKTALIDNPHLTVRKVEGVNPYRIILQDKTELPQDLHIFRDNDDHRTVIATPRDQNEYHENNQDAVIWSIDTYEDGMLNLAALLMRAGNQNISSILVEGGSLVFSSFLKRRFVDKIYIAIAPKIVGSGLPACGDLGIETLEGSIYLRDVEYFKKGEDIWVSGYPVWR